MCLIKNVKTKSYNDLSRRSEKLRGVEGRQVAFLTCMIMGLSSSFCWGESRGRLTVTPRNTSSTPAIALSRRLVITLQSEGLTKEYGMKTHKPKVFSSLIHIDNMISS